jgi:hypothetical protein
VLLARTLPYSRNNPVPDLEAAARSVDGLDWTAVPKCERGAVRTVLIVAWAMGVERVATNGTYTYSISHHNISVERERVAA